MEQNNKQVLEVGLVDKRSDREGSLVKLRSYSRYIRNCIMPILLAVTSTGCVPTSSGARSCDDLSRQEKEEVKELRMRARDHISNGDYDEAVEAARSAQQICRSDVNLSLAREAQDKTQMRHIYSSNEANTSNVPVATDETIVEDKHYGADDFSNKRLNYWISYPSISLRNESSYSVNRNSYLVELEVRPPNLGLSEAQWSQWQQSIGPFFGCYCSDTSRTIKWPECPTHNGAWLALDGNRQVRIGPTKCVAVPTECNVVSSLRGKTGTTPCYGFRISAVISGGQLASMGNNDFRVARFRVGESGVKIGSALEGATDIQRDKIDRVNRKEADERRRELTIVSEVLPRAAEEAQKVRIKWTRDIDNETFCTNMVDFEVPCTSAAAVSRRNHLHAKFSATVINRSSLNMRCKFAFVYNDTSKYMGMGIRSVRTSPVSVSAHTTGRAHEEVYRNTDARVVNEDAVGECAMNVPDDSGTIYVVTGFFKFPSSSCISVKTENQSLNCN